MNDDEEWIKRLTNSLDQQAQRHPQRQAVLDHVRAATRPAHPAKKQLLALTMAASLCGFTLMPASLSPARPDASIPLSFLHHQLISPQAVEDLEMLQVLGVEGDQASEYRDVTPEL
jgi:hypothetical protein